MNEHNPPMALPNGYVYGEQVCVSVCVCACVRMRACMCTCVCVYVCIVVIVLKLLFLPIQGLVAMAEENKGIVVCPRTKDSFKISEIKKVYVM